MSSSACDAVSDIIELQIIPFAPPLNDRPIKKSCTRWKKVVDQILADVPDQERWIKRRQEVGLHTVEENHLAIAAVAGNYTASGMPQLNHRSKSLSFIADLVPSSSTDGLLRSAKAYAWITKGSQVLRSFQELVFVSLCAVLEQHVSVEYIDQVMRICISDSEPINLKRLRLGAIWANRAIFNSTKAGWGSRATEIFLLCMCISKHTFAGYNDMLISPSPQAADLHHIIAFALRIVPSLWPI